MTTRQFRRKLDHHGLSQAEFVEQFGANRRTVNRWWTGEYDIPKRVDDWFALKECRDRLEKVEKTR